MNRRLTPIIVVMLSVGGCGGNATAPTTTSPSSPSGNWSGSISDQVSGDGSARLSLSDQAPNALVGTWSATFRNGDSFSGPAVANLLIPNGYAITLAVDPQPPCSTGSEPDLLGFTLINVVVTSRQLTAVSGRLSCSGPSFGTVNLSKQ
jgi:hypothetical protein